MAISTYQELSWENSKSFYLSQIWSLYCREINWDYQLCDLGYYGYADPVFSDTNHEPDILSFHPKGDVQHLNIETFEDYTFGEDEKVDREKIENRITSVAESKLVSDETVSNYLDSRKHDFEPTIQEVVCVLPADVYEEHPDFIEGEISDQNIILWLVEANGTTSIWKEVGSHSNLTLDDEISSRYKAYPSSNDILRYSRSTDDDRLKYEFIQRLVRHCGRMNITEFSFEEVDNIMVETNPPILGHIPENDRKDNYWANYIYSMLHRFDLLELSEKGENIYIWKQEKFVNEPRYRHRILRELKESLDLDSEGNS